MSSYVNLWVLIFVVEEEAMEGGVKESLWCRRKFVFGTTGAQFYKLDVLAYCFV